MKEKRKENGGGTEENRSVTVTPARSKTLLCKLTLRVCIAGIDERKEGEQGEKDGEKRGDKETEGEEEHWKRGQCE